MLLWNVISMLKNLKIYRLLDIIFLNELNSYIRLSLKYLESSREVNLYVEGAAVIVWALIGESLVS